MAGIIKKYLLRAGLVTVILLVAYFLVSSPDAFASDRDIIKKEKNLEDVRRQIREGKEFVEEIKGRETSILTDIESISRELNSVRVELRRSKNDLKKVKKKVDATERRIKKLNAEKVDLFSRLEKRLKAIYMMRTGEAVRVLFSPGGAGSLGRGDKFLTSIMESDRELIKECEANIVALSNEMIILDDLKKEREQVMLAHKRKERKVESKRIERRRLLKKTKNEKAELEALVSELTVAASELSVLIESLKKDKVKVDYTRGFGAMKGRLMVPVKGRIVQHYGKVKHPKFNTITFNNGIIIAASLGEAVHSVYEGRVAYVGWLKGYGQVMIVEHEGGFYTLYGQLFKLLKSKGDTVVKGEEIGLVGDSGLSDSPGLYFEVREGGVPRDPLGWMTASGR